MKKEDKNINIQAVREAIEENIDNNMTFNTLEAFYKEHLSTIREKMTILQKSLEEDYDPDVSVELNQLKLEHSYFQTRIKEVQLKNDLITHNIVRISKMGEVSKDKNPSIDLHQINRELGICKRDLIAKANEMGDFNSKKVNTSIQERRPRSCTFIEDDEELPEQVKKENMSI